MTYDALKKLPGKVPVYIVELYLDRCEHVYGEAPCTASGDPTLKCFNTLSSCQDPGNYSLPGVGPGEDPGVSGKKVYRFSSTRIVGFDGSSTLPEGDPPVFPTILSVETAPTRLDPGRGLGIRSSVEIELQDHPYSDVGVDPYLRERAVNFANQGSFWGRMQARNKFYEGRSLVLRQGYLEGGLFVEDNFKSRRYAIHRISGPDDNGRVVVEAKDFLKFADSSRRQFPIQSSAELPTAINNSDTTFSILDRGSEILNAFNSGQRYIRIDDEVLYVNSVVATSGAQYSVNVVRASLPPAYPGPMDSYPHGAEATVQVCHYFDDEPVQDIIYYLLNAVCEIDAFYLPLAEWTDSLERVGYQNYTFTRLLVEPEGVKDLLQELTEHNILLWWDEREQSIRVSVVFPQIEEPAEFQQRDVLDGSVSVTYDVKHRVSQTWVFFGDRNPILDRDKASTYQRVEVRADLDAESLEEYRESKIKKIYSRWLPISKRSVAAEISSRMLAEFRDTKRVVKFSLDPKDDEVWTGDLAKVPTYAVQDQFGVPDSGIIYRVLEVEEILNLEGVQFRFMASEAGAAIRFGLIAPNEDPADGITDFPDYTPSSQSLKDRYGFIGPNSGEFPDNTDPYQIA